MLVIYCGWFVYVWYLVIWCHLCLCVSFDLLVFAGFDSWLFLVLVWMCLDLTDWYSGFIAHVI